MQHTGRISISFASTFFNYGDVGTFVSIFS